MKSVIWAAANGVVFKTNDPAVVVKVVYKPDDTLCRLSNPMLAKISKKLPAILPFQHSEKTLTGQWQYNADCKLMYLVMEKLDKLPPMSDLRIWLAFADSMCKLALSLIQLGIYYPDFKKENVMVRNRRSGGFEIVLVDLDTLCTFENQSVNELAPTYFPLQYPAKYVGQWGPPSRTAYDQVGAYVTVFAMFGMLSDLKAAFSNTTAHTTPAAHKQLLLRLKAPKGPPLETQWKFMDRLIKAALVELQHDYTFQILYKTYFDVKPFNIPLSEERQNMLLYRQWYECRASFVDRALDKPQ